ncbi:gamma-glutamyltransferase [Zhihengliuella halotolerans]|uniref:gamma-glutamyltransferase n=1 Tax=Zhihengliuella halotolerans TaxID=370736 RepID=UPI0015E066C6|nr:gamma-glutamyltransferase [Zhihengliuella halotolerans]
MPRKAVGAAVVAVVLATAACSSPAGDPVPSAPPGTSEPPSPSASSTPSASEEAPEESLLSEHAVAAAHPAAVDAGMEILDAGGNAADAAVATAFAVAVVEPFASGIGGGGSTVLVEPGADPTTYDYREVVAQDGVVPESGTGIPGFVSGMAEIHAEHGRLDWKQVLAPAIELAEGGFEVTPFLAHRLEADAGPSAVSGLSQFHAGWGAIGEGDRLVQEDLAGTMRVLADEGAEAFYTGSLVEDLSRVDGIDPESLAAYETEKLEPVTGEVGDYEVVSMAPALPGAAVIQMLQIAEAADVGSAEPGSADYIDRLSGAWMVAEDNVARHFGDARFVDVPVDRLTDAATNRRLAEDTIGPASVQQSHGATGENEIVAGNTTHLSVVDSDGLAISMTNTVTNFWGAAESVGGFFLNNQLSRFETDGSANNRPAPGRKSVSWAAPTVVLDDEGRPVLGIGSPGGHQIPNILSGVLVPWALQDATLQEAVDAPRHHLQDGVLALESEPAPEVTGLLRSRGWDSRVTTRHDAVFGSVQALEIDYDDGTVTGAADARREAAYDVGQP